MKELPARMEHAESGNAPLFAASPPVKIRTDHNGHTVTTIKKAEQYDTLMRHPQRSGHLKRQSVRVCEAGAGDPMNVYRFPCVTSYLDSHRALLR